MINYFNSDLVPILKDRKFQVFAHGCNCFCTMGAGIALHVKKEFPEAYNDDLKTEKGDKKKLGTIRVIDIGNNKFVINAYTQYAFWGHRPNVSYSAIYDCFEKINHFMTRNSLSDLTIPKIGAGLAGGNWDDIERLIKKTMDPAITINVFYK